MHCCHLDLVRQIVNLLYATKRDEPDPKMVMLMSCLIFHQPRKIERTENSLNWYHILKNWIFIHVTLHQKIEWSDLTRIKLSLSFQNVQNCYTEVFRITLKLVWFKPVLKITCFGVRTGSNTLQDKVFLVYIISNMCLGVHRPSVRHRQFQNSIRYF